MIKKIVSIICMIVVLCNFNIVNVIAKNISARSAILYNKDTNEVLYGKDIDKKLPMASTTKIMTAVVLFTKENIDLDKEFIVDSNAIKVEGSSMGLMEGDVVTLRTLAYGLMLKSGNDAAGAISAKVAGSVDKFVELMNKKAREIGLLNTNFVTPSGLDDENHYSTALDMAKLASYALDIDELAKICSSKSAKLKYGNPPYERTLRNSNRLLKEYDGAIGMKTGFTKKSGRCLVSAAKRDGNTLVVVTLGAGDDWNVHKNLFDFGFGKRTVKELNEDSYIFNTSANNGVEMLPLKVGLNGDTSFNYILNNGDLTEIISIDSGIVAPIHYNQIVGKIKYLYNNKIIKEVPLVAKEEIRYIEPEKKSFFSKMFDFLGFK